MTETEHEMLYWRITLAFVVMSPFVAWSFSGYAADVAWNQDLFFICLVGSIPAAIITEILICIGQGRALRIWIKNPDTTIRHTVSLAPGEAVAEILARLEKMSFQDRFHEDGTISFAKVKASQIHSFSDHAFRGWAVVSAQSSSSEVEIHLVQEDTLLIESGESANLNCLAQHLGLKSETYLQRNVPFTVYCGLASCLISSGLAALTRFSPEVLGAWVPASSVAGIGFLGISLFNIQRDHTHLFGRRIIFGGMFLSLLLLTVWALKRFGQI